MTEFFQAHRQDIIYSIFVIVIVIVLRVLTNMLHTWVLKEKKRKFPYEKAKSTNLLKKILNTLWIVLGVIALSYLFVENDEKSVVIKDFKTVLYLGLVSAITIIVATTVNLWFKLDVQKKLESNQDPTSIKFLKSVVLVAIYLFGLVLCLLAFPSLKGVAQTAIGGAGVAALIIGVASQEALSNLIGGIFIIVFKPFKIGDTVKVTDAMVGSVTDITLRHTVIRNFENKMIVIPNAIMNKEKLINYDLGELKCCERIEIGISYDSDIDLAKKIMQEEFEKHPLIFDNRTLLDIEDNKPVVKTALIALNDSSVTIRAWAWAQDFNDSFQLKIDVLESVKKRFDKEGIEIPFPYRTVVMKKDKNEKKDV
ncbi:mechanosensitive ion channel family protein [Psychroserpens sp. NJDZ02]|uniref:mechanosensitive ion channel family protein n=1 Tax=Psychroserpens sp. NJDZ02 TaxID=2570561 RepID=UPI0010A8CD25|nr:mechanosensitive ion channel family protein [Psychroserpens sp. NJDZ02]QCE42014.1 mechanosensitive ion channel family protein [Psychroserpens sp. NJDZ02]